MGGRKGKALPASCEDAEVVVQWAGQSLMTLDNSQHGQRSPEPQTRIFPVKPATLLQPLCNLCPCNHCLQFHSTALVQGEGSDGAAGDGPKRKDLEKLAMVSSPYLRYFKLHVCLVSCSAMYHVCRLVVLPLHTASHNLSSHSVAVIRGDS